MKFHINSLLKCRSQMSILCLLSFVLCFLCSVGIAEEGVQEPVSAGDTEVSVPSFPYVAGITGDNVNIRSGPGTNYYSCGKLNKADRVKVVGIQFSWCRIAPPVGSFSWISTQYVSIDPDNPAIGTVTGDDVRVYAGSDYVKPMHSTTLQGKLNKGDKVKLTGQQQDGYYKISPPSFAYLWVLGEYTEPLGSVGEVPLIVEPKIEARTETEAVVATKLPLEAEKLKEYYALQKRISAERVKPMSRQDYTSIKKAFADIASNKAAGKAARYSAFALKQIERYELALKVDKEVRLQNQQLQRIKQRIEESRVTRLSEVEDLGRFAAIGKFYTSNIYGPEPELRHYLITDDAGKIICYALPSGPVLKVDLSKFIDRKVGLVGSIEPHRQTSGALVRFTEITELK